MSLSRQFSRVSRLLTQCQRTAVIAQQRCNQSTDRDLDQMLFTFASPGDVYYDKKVVKQVDVPSQSGVFGVLARHVPTIAALRPGIVTVFEQDATKKFFVSSGTVTVNNDSTVQILAEEAHPLDRFDPKEVQNNLSKYQSVVGSAKSEAEKAEAQIAVECLEEISKALASH